VDIAALCQFLANALRAADSFDLLVLKELVETLTGISITSDLSDEQVANSAGDALCSVCCVARVWCLVKHLPRLRRIIQWSFPACVRCGPCALSYCIGYLSCASSFGLLPTLLHHFPKSDPRKLQIRTAQTPCMQHTHVQLEGSLGGDALSSLVLMRDTDKSRKTWARGAKRLLDALQRGPSQQHLALPLLLLVAQQRQIIMVGGRSVHDYFCTT